MQHQIQETGYFNALSLPVIWLLEYVLVTLLGSKDHFSVTPELLLSTNQHLDIARMQLAARIDLTEIPNQPGAKQIHFVYPWPGRAQSR